MVLSTSTLGSQHLRKNRLTICSVFLSFIIVTFFPWISFAQEYSLTYKKLYIAPNWNKFLSLPFIFFFYSNIELIYKKSIYT